MPTQYQPGIPTGTVDLDQDYINIRNNFTQLNTTYGSDHVAYDVVENNGYHKTVHIIPRNPDNDPNTIAGIGQLYSRIVNDGYDTDTVLYFKTGPGTGTGDKLQLTSNFEPLKANRGYTFLPGGLVLQWGRIAAIGNSGTVTFSNVGGIAFSSAAYVVSITDTYTSGDPPTLAADIAYTNLTNTSFDWVRNGTTKITGFSWIAIGI